MYMWVVVILCPPNTRCRIISRNQKGTIILTTKYPCTCVSTPTPSRDPAPNARPGSAAAARGSAAQGSAARWGSGAAPPRAGSRCFNWVPGNYRAPSKGM